MAERCRIFIGNIVHCKAPFQLEVLDKGFIAVNNKKIVAVNKITELENTKNQLKLTDIEEIILTDTQIIIPGLIDTHIHASQYPNLGLGYDKQLLDWLQTYTFPLEKKFKNLEFAKKVYNAVVKSTLSHGTTTACYFATLHLDSTIELANAAISAGQRAFIGKVNMTELCPKDYSETIEQSISDTKTFIKIVLEKKSDIVKPVITPRFALSCTTELMKELGCLANIYDLNIQSHISENQDEVKEVKKKFGKNYAQVYDECNLLTPKTVLAHGVYLTDSEKKLLGERGTSISHCPGSNCCLQSGNCNVRALIDAGVNVGLGTDVSGGNSPSIIQSMRAALETSIQFKYEDCTYKTLNCYDAFYLATLGGAKALALEQKVGNFEVGKEFDALLVDLDVKNSNIDYLETCTVLELLQKFIYTGDDRNIISVYVCGKKVK